MKTIFRNISSFILLMLLLACAGLSYSQEFELNANARLIHNEIPLWGENAKVTLEFVQKIGQVDEIDENYNMFSIEDVERDKAGNIYILDAKNKRIQKFDKNGRYLKTLGGRGDGPGKFMLPHGLVLDTQDNLYVSEAFGSLIKVLNPDGKEINNFAVNRSMNRVLRFLTPKTLITGGYNRILMDSSLPPDKLEYPVYSVYGLNGRLRDSIGIPIVFKMFSEDDVHRFSIDGAAPFAVDGDGNLFITYKYKNRIEKRDSKGNLIFRADRPIMIEETNYRIENGFMVSPNVISTNIGVDHNNMIWVETYFRVIDEGINRSRFNLSTTETDNARFEIFDHDGILLGYIPIPMDYYRMRIKEDRIFFIEIDRFSVHEYRIVEK